jgi:hypothetical protein
MIDSEARNNIAILLNGTEFGQKSTEKLGDFHAFPQWLKLLMWKGKSISNKMSRFAVPRIR